MRQQLSVDGDNYTFQPGKVRQGSQAGLVQQPEHHLLLLCTILQLSLTGPPLHCPAEAVGILTGIFILQHFQQGREHQSEPFPQQGNKLIVPDGSVRSLRIRQ